jgi:hypothetical protein
MSSVRVCDLRQGFELGTPEMGVSQVTTYIGIYPVKISAGAQAISFQFVC